MSVEDLKGEIEELTRRLYETDRERERLRQDYELQSARAHADHEAAIACEGLKCEIAVLREQLKGETRVNDLLGQTVHIGMEREARHHDLLCSIVPRPPSSPRDMLDALVSVLKVAQPVIDQWFNAKKPCDTDTVDVNEDTPQGGAAFIGMLRLALAGSYDEADISNLLVDLGYSGLSSFVDTQYVHDGIYGTLFVWDDSPVGELSYFVSTDRESVFVSAIMAGVETHAWAKRPEVVPYEDKVLGPWVAEPDGSTSRRLFKVDLDGSKLLPIVTVYQDADLSWRVRTGSADLEKVFDGFRHLSSRSALQLEVDLELPKHGWMI